MALRRPSVIIWNILIEIYAESLLVTYDLSSFRVDFIVSPMCALNMSTEHSALRTEHFLTKNSVSQPKLYDRTVIGRIFSKQFSKRHFLFFFEVDFVFFISFFPVYIDDMIYSTCYSFLSIQKFTLLNC